MSKAKDTYLLENDGFLMPEVGPWAKSKYRKIEYYEALFSCSMKHKWKCRVYLDLFSCAGKCKVRETSEIIPGSPLIALSVDYPFDKYVFCEKEAANLEALESRVRKYFPDRDCSYILGDSNENVESILSTIPKFNKDYTGLTLCFVDPYKSGELDFNTIKSIASNLYIDFLVLIPTFMDINRNEHNYSREAGDTLDRFLGTNEWRSLWSDDTHPGMKFGVFIADQFSEQMKKIGFRYGSTGDYELIRMGTGKNLPLYHLAFFSKSELGLKFWRETKKNTNS